MTKKTAAPHEESTFAPGSKKYVFVTQEKQVTENDVVGDRGVIHKVRKKLSVGISNYLVTVMSLCLQGGVSGGLSFEHFSGKQG